jgi:2-polyprenyl-3-methyl-5-hydroxy-6-metoxy-1,4-benzoquinol methylase
MRADPPGPARMEWTPERVRRFWDYESRQPETYYSFKYGPQVIDRASELLGLTRASSAGTVWLDYGCGYGSFSELLLGRGFGLVIHDLSEDSLAACRERCGAHPGFRGTLAECEVPIDVVSLLEVAEHVEQQTMRQIVDELRSACRPGARLVITTPNAEELTAPAATVYCPQCDTVRHRWQHLRSFTAASLERELLELGLQDVRVSEENFPRDRRFSTRNPLRRLKRLLCDGRRFPKAERPNLLAIARL